MNTFVLPAHELLLVTENIFLLLRKLNMTAILTGGSIIGLSDMLKGLYSDAQAERLGIQLSEAKIFVDLAEHNALKILLRTLSG